MSSGIFVGGVLLNSKQLQNVIVLSQTGNFSQAAQILGITQPALSKQIMALEKELGVRIFRREQSPIRLTAAGERFIQEARELVYKEEQLLRTMERFRSGEEGRLTVGISPFRSLYLIPGLVKKLKGRYPGLQVCLKELGSDILRKEAAEGKYDFAIVNLPVDEAALEVTPLEPDKLVLVVPQTLWDKVPAGQEIKMSQCADLPFVVVSRGQELRELFENLCTRAQIHPPIAMEVVGVTTAWAMAQAGIGAALVPLQFVKDEQFEQQVRLLTLKDNTFIRQPAVVYRRGQPLSRYAKTAIEFLTK